LTRQQAEKIIRDRVAQATKDGGVVYSEHKIQCAISSLLGEEAPAEPEENSTEETAQERLKRVLCMNGDPTGGMWM
jgi:hypothetical protein